MGWEFSAAMFFVVLGSVAEPARLAILNRIINASERGRLWGPNARRPSASLGSPARGLFAVMFASVVGAVPNATRVRTPFFACRSADDRRIGDHPLVGEPATEPVGSTIGNATTRGEGRSDRTAEPVVFDV